MIEQPPPLPLPPSSQLEKPGLVTAIGLMTLANGILNIIYGLTLTGGIVLTTLGIGLCCAPLTILPAVLGIFEVIFAAKIITNPAKPVQPSVVLATLEICVVLWGNMLSLVVGILNLVFFQDESVKAYFARLNSQIATQ